MKTNLGLGYPRYVPVNPVLNTIAGGAAGWIDWDISAIVPTSAIMVAATCYTNAGQSCGIRNKGETPEPLVFETLNNVTLIGNCSSSRVIQGYREAADNDYRIVGYWY